MVDIALSWSNELWRGDWRLNDEGTLADDDDLATAVMLSLFSDRTALPDDVIPDSGPIRGWWADTFRDYPLGSRLWLLWREKETEITRRRAEEYGREAMQWFVDAGIAKSVEVSAAWVRRGLLELLVTMTPPIGERRIFRFPIAWAAIAGVGA